jgi:hypothetical protein
MENHGGMISTGELTGPPELSGKPTSSHLVERQEELAKEIMNFAFRSISFVLRISVTCRKIFRHGADGFTSPPKEGVLQTS